MKITIKRFCENREPDKFVDVSYELPRGIDFLLEALSYIKKEIDPTLSFSSGCRSGVCGSCALKVNDKEILACEYRLKDGDFIEALDKMRVIKDLVVDHEKSFDTLKRSKTYFKKPSAKELQTPEDERKIERQSDCILCSSCFSSCPVLEVDSEFLGPFALTRAYRYLNDSRSHEDNEILDAIQEKGIWDCTLCGECTSVCPQSIDPKNDILLLRTKSVQAGYSNPNFSQGGDDFLSGGFDPNF